MAGNELVAGYKLRVGRAIGSAALEAEGQHSRIDGLTSLAAAVGLIGVRLGFPLADPLAGFAITIVILWIVVDVGRDIPGRLLDAMDPEVVDEVERIAASAEGVQGVHGVRARWLGHEVTVELHIDVDGDRSLIEAHAIAERVRHELLHHIPRLHDAIVHMDPVEAERGRTIRRPRIILAEASNVKREHRTALLGGGELLMRGLKASSRVMG